MNEAQQEWTAQRNKLEPICQKTPDMVLYQRAPFRCTSGK